MPPKNLSYNFTTYEVFKDLDRDPTPIEWQTAALLCNCILQPYVRGIHGPTKITSGWRPYNTKRFSDHDYREGRGAIDFVPLALIDKHEQRLQVFAAIARHCKDIFGQLIWYEETNHIHVSMYRADKVGELLICTSKKDNLYLPLDDPAEIRLLDSRFGK